MCFKKPKLDPKPVVPTVQQAAIKAEQQRRVKLDGAEGRDSTVLTSPLGVSDFGEKTKKRVLLGVG